MANLLWEILFNGFALIMILAYDEKNFILNAYILSIPGSVRVWRGGEGKTEEPVLVTGWHLAPELVPQVKSFFLKHFFTLYHAVGKTLNSFIAY